MNEKLLATELLDVGELIIDPSYQRPMLHGHIESIAKAFDPKALGFLAVSLRSGEGGRSYYAVLDGQQRLAALRMIGEKQAPCHVYCDLTVEEEAELFQTLNNSRQPTKSDLFRAKLAAGNKTAIAIKDAVEACSWQLDLDEDNGRAQSENWCAWTVNSVTALQQLHSVGGVELIIQTLTALNVWRGQRMAGSADIIKGMGFVWRSAGRDINPDTLREAMAKKSPSSVIGDAQTLYRFGNDIMDAKPRYKRIAEVLIRSYNAVASSTRRLIVKI